MHVIIHVCHNESVHNANTRQVPFDRMRLVFPPIPAALITLVIYVPLAHILPMTVNESRGLLAGALIGYIMYDLTHYYLHHGSPETGSYFGNLKTYHVAHHLSTITKVAISCSLHVLILSIL
jgi:4-hydroxysphinganine ceramide fatty acyl 2-hydroxylase